MAEGQLDPLQLAREALGELLEGGLLEDALEVAGVAALLDEALGVAGLEGVLDELGAEEEAVAEARDGRLVGYAMCCTSASRSFAPPSLTAPAFASSITRTTR